MNAKAQSAGDEKMENEKKTPDFNVKSSERELVGSAWKNDGKFGPYIAIRLNRPVKDGKVFLYPRKGNKVLA